MRAIAALILLVILSAGISISYFVYRQLDTDIVVLSAVPELKQNNDGEMCGTVDFVLAARALGRWTLGVGDGQEVSGIIAVEGDQSLDVGLRIKSPSNRLVLYKSQPEHIQEFKLTQTIRGDYLFEFDNRHSSLTQKHITVLVCMT